MEESSNELSEKFSFKDFEKLLEEYEELRTENVKPGKKTRNPSSQPLASLEIQRRSKRSLFFVALLCLGLGIFVLVFFLVVKPEGEKSQIVAKPIRLPIPSVERTEETMALGIVVGMKEGEEKLPEGEKTDGEKPSLLIPPEAPLMSREEGMEEKALIIVGTEIPESDEEEKVTEAEGKGPVIAGGIETKPQEAKPRFAKVEEPKILAVPEQKLPVGGYTVNVGSFREKVWAVQLIKELEGKGYRAFIEETVIPKKGKWYRVAVGQFPSRREAQSFAQELRERDGMNSFVRKLKEVKQ